MKELRLSGIIKESIVDGPGIRMVLFAQGCKHNCVGCHNPETHSFQGGKLYSMDSILEQIKGNPLLDGVTFSGGEPFEQAVLFSELAAEIKKLGLNIMTYTGYTLEHLLTAPGNLPGAMELVNHSDILVDGRFDQTKRNILLKFRGSENQRVIDLKNSISKKEIILVY